MWSLAVRRRSESGRREVVSLLLADLKSEKNLMTLLHIVRFAQTEDVKTELQGTTLRTEDMSVFLYLE